MENTTKNTPVALITGAARRIGAEIAQHLHHQGYRVIIHCHHSLNEANALSQHFNDKRPNSAKVIRKNLSNPSEVQQLAEEAIGAFGQLDALINNASSFYPTPIHSATTEQWDDLLSSNAQAPLFLSQALALELKKQHGCIINLADIHGEKPLSQHTVYCMAKAANVMLTKSLAKELAPEVRVNAIAPGAILWPEQEAALDGDSKQKILSQIPLQKPGHPSNIASSVAFLLSNAYITGQILAVDGGRSLNH